MKTFVITLSKTFPRTHIHSGRETNFAHLLGNGLNLTEDGLKICRHKIHTVRTNLPLWEKRISEIQSGQAVLSIREWTGRPYGSPQKELARLTGSDGVGVQALKLKDLFSSTVIDGEKVELPDLAAHDGLSFSDWYDSTCIRLSRIPPPLKAQPLQKWRTNCFSMKVLPPRGEALWSR